MSELRDLYQEVIIDHSKRPRNFHKIADASHHGEGYNPLCGDKVDLYLRIENGVIKDIAFEGKGCAISTAAASMMTEALRSKTVEEAEALFRSFQGLVTGHPQEGPPLGKLEIFEGVGEFPARVKCATLPWHAALSAIRGESKPASTE